MKEASNYDDIKKVTELLKNAKVPTKYRYGYEVMEDGSVKMFGPTKDVYGLKKLPKVKKDKI